MPNCQCDTQLYQPGDPCFSECEGGPTGGAGGGGGGAGGCDCEHVIYPPGHSCYDTCRKRGGGGGCECAFGYDMYPEGHPCREFCRAGAYPGGGDNTGGGACPPGTPPGPASCCPPLTVYRADTQTCEPPDARSKQGKETCPEPAPGPDYWCDFDTAQWRRGWGGGGGGGKPGGGGGGGAGNTRFGGPFPSTEYERAMSEALTNLAKQFGQYGKSYFETAFPGYKSGMEYFQTLLTGDRGAIQAATAPTTEAIASQYGAQRRSLGAGLLRGGARDLAEAELARSEASDIARTYSGVQPGAAQSLMQGGLEGSQVAESFLGMAGNTYSNLVNTAVTSRLTTEGMNLQRELGLKQISAQVSIAQMQNQTARDLGFAGLDLQYKSLQEQVAQFNRTAGTQESQFNRTFGFQQRQALFAQQQAKGSANAQLMMGAMALMLAKSDERLKQDIQPLPESRDVLGALSTLRGVTFRWRHAPDAPTEIGVIAQDVQKVLPELVHTPGPDGYLVVDYQKLTAYLIEVAKAQQAQLTTLSARIAALEGRKE